MKLSGSRWVRRMNSVLGLCLCLVLICLATAGAIAYTNQSYTGVRIAQAEPLQQNEVDYALSAVAGGPVIQVWKAAPMELATADAFAVYTFKVNRATDVSITEAGANIKNINNPSGATLNGTADGLPASAIAADASGQFICTIVATNGNGTATKSLTLSFSKELLATGQRPGQSEETGGQTGQRTPQWGPLMRASITSPLSNIINKEPKFFKCPSDCDHCLKPDEAASKGYTQRCSEELCYYSPPENQKWYCYKPTPGWCCANGKVNASTKDECDKIQGYWSTSQADATQACQPGCCCVNGQISYPSTQTQCAQMYGQYYNNLGQCKELCQPQGCCCVNGQMSYPTTQSQCNQMYGTYYTSLSQCKESCKVATGCCCVNGQISYPSTQSQCSQMYGTYYTNLGQCRELCQAPTCWCCLKGQVYQTTQAQCTGSGGACYSSQSQAQVNCRSGYDNQPYYPPTNLR